MIRALVVKEARAQVPVFVASLIAIAAAGPFSRFHILGTFAYLLGAAALGALAIGHEYIHRTLGVLLSQPVPRHRLLLVKLGVLALMLIVLSAVAAASGEARPPDAALAFAVLPVLAGLCLAPWLTMVGRSPIAGAIFTLTLPGLILSASALAFLALHGHGPGEGFDLVVASRGTLALCAIGSVMTWPAFLRLEAVDGPGPQVHLPPWFGRRTAAAVDVPASTTRSPVWELVKKELRLQHMAFAVTGIYLIGWFALTLSLRSEGIDADEVFTVLTLPYGALIAMLIGALASAEERQLGTLEWQLLLPVAAWRQWAIKVATVVPLALLLALGVPVLLAAVSGARTFGWLRPEIAAGVAALTIGGLYVSSLSGSGVGALLASVPALMGVVMFVEFLFEYPGAAASRMFASVSGWPSPHMAPSPGSLRAFSVSLWLIGASAVALVLWFGLTNHRSADRAVAHLRTQMVWIALCLTLAVTLAAAVRAWLWVPL
jgi:hypothetical protein